MRRSGRQVLLVMAAAICWVGAGDSTREALASMLLWVPLPFYVYSIAYGSVPIFIPQLWPHSYYNSRYGMELLPALALFAVFSGEWFGGSMERMRGRWWKRLMQPILILLVALNTIGMMYRIPLVLKEAHVNSTTRIPFESCIGEAVASFAAGVDDSDVQLRPCGRAAAGGDSFAADDK